MHENHWKQRCPCQREKRNVALQAHKKLILQPDTPWKIPGFFFVRTDITMHLGVRSFLFKLLRFLGFFKENATENVHHLWNLGWNWVMLVVIWTAPYAGYFTVHLARPEADANYTADHRSPSTRARSPRNTLLLFCCNHLSFWILTKDLTMDKDPFVSFQRISKEFDDGEGSKQKIHRSTTVWHREMRYMVITTSISVRLLVFAGKSNPEGWMSFRRDFLGQSCVPLKHNLFQHKWKNACNLSGFKKLPSGCAGRCFLCTRRCVPCSLQALFVLILSGFFFLPHSFTFSRTDCFSSS